MNSPTKRSGKDVTAGSFGARLRELMVQRGFVSPGARSGVDVARLAQVAATTYEMARRYADGVAMPRPEKVAAIAEWLGVSPSSLAYGDKAPGAGIDERLLQECIEAVTAAQTRTRRQLTTEKMAHLVAVLYQEAAAGKLPARESLDLMVRAAA
jgi:transcriptional regulator with XRE-family HTH domain